MINKYVYRSQPQSVSRLCVYKTRDGYYRIGTYQPQAHQYKPLMRFPYAYLDAESAQADLDRVAKIKGWDSPEVDWEADKA